MAGNHHQLSAIMFSDIVGYTALMGRNEAKALELLKRNRKIQKPLIEKYQGVWIKEMGDGMMARFDSAYDATKCAIEIQKKAQKNFKGRLRIGLHLGEIVIENGDIFGDDVNIAARIESYTDPGGIYISEPIQKALQSHADIQTKYLGPVELKNVQELVKLHYITGHGLATPSNRKLKQIQQAQSRKVKRKLPLLFLLLVFLAISVFTINYWFGNRTDRKIKAIAVLPFVNLTGSDEEQYFVDMMHDAMITEVSRISDLIVRSRTSTLQFKDSDTPVPEIARILDVDAVIESTVSKTGDSVYMNIQLIKTRPEEDHIWADSYQRDTRYILSLYGELAKTVASEINVQLTPMEDRLLSEKKEVDPEAYKAYMSGQFHWKMLSKEALELAEQYYLKAIEIDPNYAEAYLGLAGVGGGLSIIGIISSEEARSRNEKMMAKVLELDSGLWQAHSNRASKNIWRIWNFEEGIKQYEFAIQLNPNDPFKRAYYAQALCIAYRDYERAEKEGAYAIKIDPIDNLYKALYGQTLNFCRKYNKAERIFMEVLESDPLNAQTLSNLKTTYHMQKRYAEAIEIWKIDNRKDTLAVEALESGYESGGYKGALKAFAEYSIQKSKEQYVTPWRILTIYTRAGMKEEALDYLEKAYEAHDPNMPYISTDPIFDYLRDDPRFIAVYDKMNFPE